VRPEPVSYDDLLVESAVLAFVIGERPGGVTIPELSRLLNAERGEDGEDDAVERAVRELVRARLLRCAGGLLLPQRPLTSLPTVSAEK